ncbi:hypothetical protein ACKKBG_A16360 [Auxenochlorella protothecoides x Auxenochlorella symbiontica]
MPKHFLIFAIALLLGYGTREISGNTDPGFDFFLLVRQWGPAFCSQTRCNSSPVAAFTIHGLWPQYETGNSPQSCNPNDIFATTNLNQSLINSLACTWVSYTGSNQEFWSYEWSKHGTCSLTLLTTQAEYFGAAVNLNTKYEINEALLNAGINPRTAGGGPRQRLLDVLTSAFGEAPVLRCNQQGNVLEEIWQCFDTDLQIMPCPRSVSSSRCGSSLTLRTGERVPPVCRPYYDFTLNTAAGNSG